MKKLNCRGVWIVPSAIFACASSIAIANDKPYSNQGRIDFLLHCSGCHALDGRGLENKGIPALKDQVGYFLRTEVGRAYVMQIPGLLSAGMSDARAADVTNYILARFAGASLPEHFVPYTAEEANRVLRIFPENVNCLLPNYAN